jgi:FtsP/CotA-like multicopper oxidase with cupredoxin domain
MRGRLVLMITLLVMLSVGVAAGAAYGQRRNASASARRQGELREFTLVAEPVKWEIQPGLVVDGWGYNGQIPGPTLRVTEGDLVRIHLVNHLPAPTTIHWHGIDVPPGMDGVPGLSQYPVEPGEDFMYEFIATNPGTRMYHSHTDTDGQMQLGMVGAFIIDPREPDPVHYDREFTYILTEKSLDFTPRVAMGEADILHRDAGNGRGGALQSDLFLMNERAATAIEPMTIAPGQRIRIRLINLGNLVHAMHLHGHSFRIVATDGNPVPPGAQWLKDTVNIAPGERYDLAVEGTNPGVWMFHCHINNHAANGMSTVLAYDGAQPLAGGEGHGSHGPSAPLPVGPGASSATPAAPHPSATPAATPTSGASSATGATGGEKVVMLDNRYNPTRLTVRAGTTVTWTNTGSNLHTTTSFDGLWDSGSLQHDESFSFTFSTPGAYRFLCRQHLLQGMTGTITVEPP